MCPCAYSRRGCRVCRGAIATSPARGTYQSGICPTGPYTFVNDAAGAGIFYNSVFFGGSMVFGNVEAGFIWGGHEMFDRSGLGVGPAGERTAFANLDLQVWSMASGSFSTLVAKSVSTHDNQEFLRFILPPAGDYGLRMLAGMVEDVGTTPVASEAHGLSWKLIVVPGPSAVASPASAPSGGIQDLGDEGVS